jgi:hypothetical protein
LAAHEVTRFPPIVQIVGLGLLAVYVLMSIVGRLSPRFRWLWRDPRKRNRFGHIVEYTLIPAAVLAAASVAVVYNWDYRVPLSGGWTTTDLILGPGAALLGLLLIVSATPLGRDADEKDATDLRSWLPFILVIAGIALMSVGIFRFGRAVKQKPAETQPKTQAHGSSMSDAWRFVS